MQWERLLCGERIRQEMDAGEEYPSLNSEFEKDYHRIIISSAFRRLQDKTQVFALDKSDFIRTRLTHSLEVSSFARFLGQATGSAIISRGLDPDFTLKEQARCCEILMSAGLIHDIGNPPFGHFGEDAIRDWFRRRLKILRFGGKPLVQVLSPQMQEDFLHFEGNAQALRQVSKLNFQTGENGMNLTMALLATIIKYPVSSLGIDPTGKKLSAAKMGYFYAEQPLYETISEKMGTKGVRHPLTFILEAADDIAYRTADIADACKKGCIGYDILRKELRSACERAVHSRRLVDLEKMDPVRMLDSFYRRSIAEGAHDPEFDAVQHLMSWLQEGFLAEAASAFADHYGEIMDGKYEHDLFWHTCADWVIRSLGDIAYRYAFVSKSILKMEVSAWTILNFLMDRFVPAALHYDTRYPQNMMESKICELISENYRQIYHAYADRTRDEKEKLYLRILLVTDFISGMTDTYAKDLYQKLNGIS